MILKLPVSNSPDKQISKFSDTLLNEPNEKRSLQYQSSTVSQVDLHVAAKSEKDASYLNSATQVERRKILKENCPAYLKEKNLTPVEGDDFLTVGKHVLADVGTMKITARYFPKFKAMYCIQHKAGTTNFNRFLNEIKHNSTDHIGLNEIHYGVPFMLNWWRTVQGNGKKSLKELCEQAYMGADCEDAENFKDIDHYLMVVRHPLTRLHKKFDIK